MRFSYVAVVGAVWGIIFLERVAPLFLIFIIARDLNGLEDAGTLALFVGAAWALAMPVSKFLSARMRHTDIVVLSIFGIVIFGGLSLIMASWWPFVIFRSLAGIFAGFAIPSITALTYSNVSVFRRGKYLAYIQSCTRLFGALIGPAIVTYVYSLAGWRWALATTTAMLVLTIPLFLQLSRKLINQTVTADPKEYRLKPHGQRNIYLSAVLAAACVAWLFTFSQLAIPALENSWNLNTRQAGLVVTGFGLFAWIGAIGVPIISLRIGITRGIALFTFFGFLGGLAFVFLLKQDFEIWLVTVLVVSLVFAGLSLGTLPLGISILPAESVMDRSDVGRAVRIPIIVAELFGGGILPALLVYLGQTASLQSALIVSASVVLLSGVLSLLMKDMGVHSGMPQQ